MRRRTFIGLVALGAATFLPGLALARISLRRSEENIRKYLLKEAPLGSSIEHVVNVLQRNRWPDFEVDETSGYSEQNTGKLRVVGVKHIRADLGDYRAFIFMTNVTVFWGFDANRALVDLWVWKTSDSL